MGKSSFRMAIISEDVISHMFCRSDAEVCLALVVWFGFCLFFFVFFVFLRENEVVFLLHQQQCFSFMYQNNNFPGLVEASVTKQGRYILGCTLCGLTSSLE